MKNYFKKSLFFSKSIFFQNWIKYFEDQIYHQQLLPLSFELAYQLMFAHYFVKQVEQHLQINHLSWHWAAPIVFFLEKFELKFVRWKHFLFIFNWLYLINLNYIPNICVNVKPSSRDIIKYNEIVEKVKFKFFYISYVVLIGWPN